MSTHIKAVVWSIFTMVWLCSFSIHYAHAAKDEEELRAPEAVLGQNTSPEPAIELGWSSNAQNNNWAQMQQYLHKNERRNARSQKAGWVLFGTSAGLLLLGSIPLALGDKAPETLYNIAASTWGAEAIVASVGAGLVAGYRSIPRHDRRVLAAYAAQDSTDWQDFSGALRRLEIVGARQRRSGATLLGVAAVIFSGGVVMISNNLMIFGCNYEGCREDERRARGGAVMAFVGVGAIAPSILLLRGGNARRRLARNLRSLSEPALVHRYRPALELQASPTGFTLKF